MKNLLLLILFLFISSLNLSAQELKSISGPEGYGTNDTADDRTLMPFFKDQAYIYCSTFELVPTNPTTKRGRVVRVDISDGSQFIYPNDVTLPAKGGFNAKKLDNFIIFGTGIQLAKINTTTNKVSIISYDTEDYAIFDHYIIYENYNYSGLYVVDLNTNITTQLYDRKGGKFYRLGATYYENGVLYFRSQITGSGVYYTINKYIPATKSLTEIVGRVVPYGTETYQNRDEIVKVNDNIIFLMKDTDFKMRYFSINLTSQSLNTSFTFNTNETIDFGVVDLMVFNNTLYITSEGKVYTSDGVTAPQLSNYPLFLGYGSADNQGDVLYYKNEAYIQLYTPEYGYELWKYDGTLKEKQLVKDITPGTASSFAINKNGFFNNNKLFYTVNTGPLAYSLYMTDGTSEGTVKLLDNFDYISFTDLFFEDDTIYFYGRNALHKGLCVYSPTATPIFTKVDAICAGETLSPLPTTSTNGIIGTWSPALNNTATTKYTFTPSEGQAAGKTSMTITVNPIVTPLFNQVAPICSGANLAALPTTSTNGITGIWSPALNNTSTTQYTFTPIGIPGQCNSTTTMTIIVNEKITPAFNPVNAICTGATLSALPKTSTNGITGTWSPSLNNTATTTYIFTPSTGQCGTATTMTITVNEKVTPTFDQVTPICAGENLLALPTTSKNGISGSWYPALNNVTTTLYTFTPHDEQCGTTATITIKINSKKTPTFTQVKPICSGESLPSLPTTSNDGIAGTWSPALNNLLTTKYTFTPLSNQCSNSTIMTIVVNNKITPQFNQIAPICSGTAIMDLPTISNNGISGTWSPVINNTSTTTYTFTPLENQCASQSTMTITVDPIPNNPIAEVQQKLVSGSTVGNLAAAGSNLKWYIAENSSIELSPNTLLIDGFYYVSQTVNSCQSKRTQISVTLTTLGIDDLTNNQFGIIAFPNPFKDTFGFEINTQTQETMNIGIYDMLGKLLEKKEGTPAEITHYQFGKNYQTGVYNVILNQSGRVNTYKIIKR